MGLSSDERVRRRRTKLREMGLRPVQIWVPDTRAPGFAAECRRQCEAIAAAPMNEAEIVFWDAATADAWDDLG
jgi:hypothetical protein